jgi:hypothetical protein
MLRYGFLPVSRDAVLLPARMGGTAEACMATVFPNGETAVCFSGYVYFLDSFNICLFFHGVLLGCFRLRNQMTNL